MSTGSAEALVAIAGLTVMAGVWWTFTRRAASTRWSAKAPVQRAVRVHGGYLPEEVHVPAGVPARLVFLREETASCSERVVFPDFGLSVGLPAFREVAVDVPAMEPGVHTFTCEMEMLHGRLVVDPREPAAGGVAEDAWKPLR